MANYIPDLRPKSEDTRWMLQQALMYAGGAIIAFCVALISFAVDMSARDGVYAAYIRSWGYAAIVGLVTLLVYKLIKRNRERRIARESFNDVAGFSRELLQHILEQKLNPPAQAAPPTGETARVLVNTQPSAGVHSASEYADYTSAQMLAHIQSLKNPTLEVVKNLLKAIGSKSGSDWQKCKTALLSLRKKVEPSEETESYTISL